MSVAAIEFTAPTFERLRKIRRVRGDGIIDVARICGLSECTIRAAESGASRKPYLTTRRKLELYYGPGTTDVWPESQCTHEIARRRNSVRIKRILSATRSMLSRLHPDRRENPRRMTTTEAYHLIGQIRALAEGKKF